MRTVFQDLRYAWRMLRKSPAFTAVAVLTLALGIGANAAVFSLIDALVLRPLPVREPAQLYTLAGNDQSENYVAFTYPMFQRLRQEQRVFSGVFAWSGGGLTDMQVDRATWQGAYSAVSGDFFSTLGVRPILGRALAAEDDRPGAPLVAVIGYRCWHDRYQGDPGVLGKILDIHGLKYTVVGVVPESFYGLWVGVTQDAYIPVVSETLFTVGGDFASRTTPWLLVWGRLKDGVSRAQAQAQMDTLWPGLVDEARQAAPENQRSKFMPRLLLVPAGTGYAVSLRDRFDHPLYLLMAMVGLVLVIACVNLAALLLARGASRAHEMAVRLAVGGGTWRIMRQVITEALLLAAAGALPGVLLAYWVSRLLANFVWRGFVPLTLDLTPDLRVLGFTLGATALTAVLFGAVPAWRATRNDPSGLLRVGARSVSSTGGLGKWLIAVQLLISMVLLAAANTLLARLQQVRTLDLGFDPAHVAAVDLASRPGSYKSMDGNAHWIYDRQLLETAAAVPGVQSATLTAYSSYPANPYEQTFTYTPVGGGPYAPRPECTVFMVAPNYFRTLGIPLEQGRDFDWNDKPGPPYKVIISRDLADLLFPAGALGRHIYWPNDPDKKDLEVVGVVAASRLGGIRTQTPHVFLDVFQQPEKIVAPLLMARTAADPRSIFDSLVRAAQSLGKEYVLRVQTLQQSIDDLLLPEQVMGILAAFFGGLALALAIIGLYGLMSYNVVQRTPDIAVRLALGAERGQVLRQVLREAGLLAGLGVLLGIPAAWGAMRVLPSIVAGLQAGWGALLVSGALLLASALVAALIPAYHASKVDPMVSLRCE